MKKLIALAGAALVFSACEDTTSATSSNLGNKFMSARNVTIDEANQTIDMALPLCAKNLGKAVLTTTASGPTPYTISNGKLMIDDDSDFQATGNNPSIIGVWNMDTADMLGDDESGIDFAEAGYKMYLDIDKNKFDIYINSENVCLAKLYANAMLEDTDMQEAGVTIKSQQCNKMVLSANGVDMTFKTDPTFPNLGITISVRDITCKTKIHIEQVSEKTCTTENIDNERIADSGMFLQYVESSDDCVLFGMKKATSAAQRMLRKMNLRF